jgi:hypothetical protein
MLFMSARRARRFVAYGSAPLLRHPATCCATCRFDNSAGTSSLRRHRAAVAPLSDSGLLAPDPSMPHPLRKGTIAACSRMPFPAAADADRKGHWKGNVTAAEDFRKRQSHAVMSR